MTMNAEQIARAAYAGGFRGDELTTAVAIALAESSGNRKAHNDVPPDNSYGLWQINMLGGMGPERRAQYDLGSNRELFDPETNARVAKGIRDSQGWDAWSTYGKHRQHLDEARRGVEKFQESRRAGNERPSRRDDTRRDGDRKGGDRRVVADGGKGGSVSGGGTDGAVSGGNFAVDTGLLRGYARETRGVADGLGGAVVSHVRRVRGIADDSFGKIGKESGFAAALDSYAVALQRQSRGVGQNADKLATSASRAAKAYRERDDEIAQDISKILG